MTRVLLDEGVPKQLAHALRLRGVDAVAFPNEWKQLPDGALIDRLEQEEFSILITCDKNMRSQQNLMGRNVAVLVLANNKRNAVLAQVNRIAEVLASLDPQHFTDLSAAGQLLPRT